VSHDGVGHFQHVLLTSSNVYPTFFTFTCIQIQTGVKRLPLFRQVRVVFRAREVTDTVGLSHCLGL